MILLFKWLNRYSIIFFYFISHKYTTCDWKVFKYVEYFLYRYKYVCSVLVRYSSRRVSTHNK